MTLNEIRENLLTWQTSVPLRKQTDFKRVWTPKEANKPIGVFKVAGELAVLATLIETWGDEDVFVAVSITDEMVTTLKNVFEKGEKLPEKWVDDREVLGWITKWPQRPPRKKKAPAKTT